MAEFFGEIFLFALAFIWLCVASFQDIKKREVANWLSFSLILFALAFRASYALLNNNLWFFLNGLIGLAMFYVLANIFYYGRLFAGGDAKLLMAIGVVLPIFDSFLSNIAFILLFIFGFLAAGSVYALVYTVFLVLRRKKEFAREMRMQLRKNKVLFFWCLILAILVLIVVLSFRERLFFFFPVLIFLVPFLYSYAKAIEEACMIKNVKTSELTIGDWLYKDVKAGRTIIKKDWQGLDEKQIKLLRRYKKNVMIKQGVPFVPSFLIAFIILVWLRYSHFYSILLRIF